MTLGEVVSTKHAIDLTADAKPVRKLPYQTRLVAREFVTEHFMKIMKHSIIETSNTPWALTVALYPNTDVSYRFLVHFR